MLVTKWMSKQLITIDVDESVQEAIMRLRKHQISKLPVLDKDNLVGIVTDRDVRRFWPSVADRSSDIQELVYMALHMNAGNIMTKDPVTVPWNFSLQETAEVLLDNNISGCPVVDERGKAIGMITRNDLFRALISWTGIRKDGIQIGFLSEDRPGCICEIINAIREHNGRIASLMSFDQDTPENHRQIAVMTYDLDPDEVPRIRLELGERVKMLYVLDRQRDVREIFADV